MNQQTQRWPPEQFGVYFLLNFKLLKRMKNEMSLDGYGVIELSSYDEQEVDGGFLIWTPFDLVKGYNRAMNGLAGFVDGFYEGHNHIKQ